MIHVSDKKLAANRANAQKSTGPKTASGRAVSRMNALRHGMNAADVVVPQLGETEEDFNLFFNAFIEEFNPQGAVQLLMVEQYVYDQWRLRRFRRAETGFSAQAAARGEDCRITLRCGPDNEKNPYNYNGYTRLGINRTWSDGMRARTFDHDFYTQLLRNEMRLRKSASETLKAIQSFTYEEEPDPAPDVQNEPKSPVESTPRDAKPESGTSPVASQRPPDIAGTSENASAKVVNR